MAQDRRLERQHLAVFGQHGVDRPDRRARACGDHQFGGVVAQHPAMGSDVQPLAYDLSAVEPLGVAADDA